MTEITVVGGGIAGLVASIACAEGGASVRLLEAHGALGGRARSTDAPFVANFGPHVLYANGRLWAFLRERELLPPVNRPPVSGIRFLAGGRLRRVPPLTVVAALPRLRGEAPVDADFRGWVAERAGTRAAEPFARSAGVFTFDHDPGRLSAAFVWERWRQAFLNVLPQARYVRGGWSALVAALEAG